MNGWKIVLGFNNKPSYSKTIHNALITVGVDFGAICARVRINGKQIKVLHTPEEAMAWADRHL